MLNASVIKIVKSTAPILRKQGVTLTRHFYKRMFAHNPEVKPFFNQMNQSGGTQQAALAGAIVGFASNIDNLGAMAETVELITQKHASLQIKREHYPIVGENLLASIKEVLGDIATDEVMDAWEKTYAVLTDILAGREQEIYEENINKSGGWEGFRTFIVKHREKESDIITSFYLEPKDEGELAPFLPGQYLTIRLPSPDGQTTMRNYSLSDKPGLNYYRISVKRECSPAPDLPDGYVSCKLHDEIKVGDELEVAPPCGEFTLNTSDTPERPLVLISAGVGITPVLSMLLSALELSPKRNITFIHGCLNEKVHAFRSLLNQLATTHRNLTIHYRYSENNNGETTEQRNTSTGFITQELISSLIPTRDADYYFCGPKPFMVNTYRDLNSWDIPASQINLEFFGPREELENIQVEKAA
ncbi:MAG: NO-inducible flavohemoprotein [Methyloligellaceae bacterium]